MFLKDQSVRNKALDICDCIMQVNVSSPSVWHRWWACCFTSNQPYKNIAVFLLEILFLRLLRYVKCVFPMMVILQCSLVFTVPHLVDRIS